MTLCDGRLNIGPDSFAALYIDVEWLDAKAFMEVEAWLQDWTAGHSQTPVGTTRSPAPTRTVIEKSVVIVRWRRDIGSLQISETHRIRSRGRLANVIIRPSAHVE